MQAAKDAEKAAKMAKFLAKAKAKEDGAAAKGDGKDAAAREREEKKAKEKADAEAKKVRGGMSIWACLDMLPNCRASFPLSQAVKMRAGVACLMHASSLAMENLRLSVVAYTLLFCDCPHAAC